MNNFDYTCLYNYNINLKNIFIEKDILNPNEDNKDNDVPNAQLKMMILFLSRK